ncbi:hypothetical protein PT110_09585, partial [Erysipelothrix rhusiopathiae]|nr:hypothetical protein [Erysipelothrix rhusiopathiae]
KQANKKGLAVTEIEVYDRIAKAHQDFTVTLKVDGKDVDAFTQYQSSLLRIHVPYQFDRPRLQDHQYFFPVVSLDFEGFSHLY